MADSSANAIKAGQAFVELFADDSQFTQSMTNAKVKFTSFVGLVKTAGIGGIFKQFGIGGLVTAFGVSLKRMGHMLASFGKQVATVGGSLVLAFGVATIASVRYFDSINKTAIATDSSAESVSRLAFALEQNGGQLDDIKDIQEDLRERTLNAAKGSAQQAAAFQQMGIEASEFAKLDIDERIARIAETFEQLQSPIERTNFLLALFGDSSANKVLPLLKRGAADLRAAFKQAQDTGAVVNTEDAKRATEAHKQLTLVLTALKGVMFEVVAAVFAFNGETGSGMQDILAYIKQFREWVRENKGLVRLIVAAVVLMTALGIALYITGSAFAAMGAIITGVVVVTKVLIALIGGLIGLVGLLSIKFIIVAAIVGALIYAFLKLTGLGEKLKEIFSRTFADIGKTFSDMWGGILNAIKKGDLELAWKIVTTGLLLNWKFLVLGLFEAWHKFLNTFEFGFRDAIAGVRLLANIVFSEIKITFLELVDAVIDGIIRVIQASNEVVKLQVFNELLVSLVKLRGEVGKVLNQVQKEKKLTEARLIEENEAKKKERLAEQEKAKEPISGRILELMNELKRLNAEAAKPAPPIPVPLPVAPMPHLPGQDINKQLDKLADSTKGLFQSADFQGSLGLGEANSYAKQQVDLQKQMLGELKNVRLAIEGAGVFV